MIDKLIAYSVRNKFIIGVLVVALIAWGTYSLTRIPIDAVPDITNNQVQIITTTSNLAAEEVERFVTTPVELKMQSLPGVIEIRSISRFGLSVVTVVFEENMGKYLPRQLVAEKLKEAEKEIPFGMASPEMAPITTGLGEIYQYIVRPKEGYEDQYSSTDLRTIQDWIIKRQLASIPGVIEVNTLGGHLKEYEIALDPEYLRTVNVTVSEVLNALEASNENTGGAYIDRDPNTYYIRAEGMVETLDEIGEIVVKTTGPVPILIKDIAEVRFGHAPRYGATTYNGKGEVVSGLVLMLKDKNAAKVTGQVVDRIDQIQASLPEGVVIEPFLVRSELIDRTINTVEKNLIEGGLIVIFILVLLLGNLRAGLIVASVIPLSMLFALGMMNVLGISANLMSLGAIDFGLIVDGAVIIVESIVHRLQNRHSGNKLSKDKMDAEVLDSAIRIRKSAAFGEVIILMVYIPILALTGIEGKMFRPMAMTVGLAITGALILSMTYVPMMSALFLSKNIRSGRNWSHYIMDFFYTIYAPARNIALRFAGPIIVLILLVFGVSLHQFSKLGGEFIPTLEEGDLALHQILPPGSSLEKSIEVSGMIQDKLMNNFPEVEKVVTKIGAAEVPIDPMPVETGDIMVIMAPKKEWVSARSRQAMFDTMETVLREIPGINYEFTQPIQMRFNELMTGSRGDIAVKIYGEDLNILYRKAKDAERIINGIDGIGSVKVEQITGMPQIMIEYNYPKLAQYGLQVKEINRIIRAAFAGATVGPVFEGDRKFDMAVRFQERYRKDISHVRKLYIPLSNGRQVPLEEVADIQFRDAPQQISRDDAKRRIVVSVNTGSLDTEGLVSRMKSDLAGLDLPAGYYITYGGQFENLIKARNRLSIAVPVALFIIFVLLYLTFNSIAQAALIFTAIPLSAIGGVWALWVRDMPFSISAGIGFIALFGVAVLNGIVLIAYFNQLKKEGMHDIKERIIEGTRVRLRPVIMTASVASFGFLPMAISTTAGAEVQRPLATVVIGGLITATLLTLIVLPILYLWLEKWKAGRLGVQKAMPLVIGLIFMGTIEVNSQVRSVTLQEVIDSTVINNPTMKVSQLMAEKQKALIGIGSNVPFAQFFYTGDALGQGSGLAEHSIGFTQQVHLGGYKKRNEYQAAQYQTSLIQNEVKARQLENNVASVYADWKIFVALNEQFERFDSAYTSFMDIAEARYETGESNKLELITARNKRQNLRLLKTQNQNNVGRASELIRLYMQVRDSLVPSMEGPMEMTIDISDSVVANHPVMRLMAQREFMADAGIESAKTLNNPMLNLGYAYQVFSGVAGLTGVRFGLSVPIFSKSQNSRVEAARVEKQIVHTQMSEKEFQLNTRLTNLRKQLQRYRAAIDYYYNEGAEYSRELMEASALNYRLGEIGYVQYLQALDQAYQIEIQYLKNLQQFNQTVVQLNYLSIN